jgi:hypothetical protein
MTVPGAPSSGQVGQGSLMEAAASKESWNGGGSASMVVVVATKRSRR